MPLSTASIRDNCVIVIVIIGLPLGANHKSRWKHSCEKCRHCTCSDHFYVDPVVFYISTDLTRKTSENPFS